MAYLNNIYGNAAFTGFYAGMCEARSIIKSSTATDYEALCDAAEAMAIDVDALIVFDALVSTGAGITQLAITTNTIAADEQWRAGLLHDLCAAQARYQYTESTAVAGAMTANAAAIHAAWVQGLTHLVTP